jgi:hypothetical protein
VPTRLSALLLYSLAILSITLLYAAKGPMQDSHWDAPIYLERSRDIVATRALEDYARHAGVIAQRLPAFQVVPDAYTPYWGFMRLGHSLILAAATAWTRAEIAGILAAFLLYVVMWSLAIVLAGLLAHALLRMLAPRLPACTLALGTVLAIVLSLASDSARYMSGNLVAEVPALFFFALGCYLLLLAQRYRSLPLAVASGAAGFALYTVKMEAVWGYMVFMPLLAWTLYTEKESGASFALSVGQGQGSGAPAMQQGQFPSQGPWWPGLVWSAVTVLTLFLLYSWYFWPLTDPRLFLIFAAAHERQAANPVAPIKLWFAAGGMVWLGLIASILHGWDRRALGFALVWLFLLTLPYLGGLLSGRPAQVRMYTLNLLPLMVAAAYGLSCLIANLNLSRLARPAGVAWLAAAIFLGLISHAETYRWLRELPGGWRLQQIRAYLSVPPYERIDYPLAQLASISQALYGQHGRSVLILDKQLPEEYLNLIAYMGPAPRQSKVALYAMPPAVDLGQCGKRTIRFDRSDVFFCLEPPQESRRLEEKGIHLLRLERATNSPMSGQVLARTAGLSLVRLN